MSNKPCPDTIANDKFKEARREEQRLYLIKLHNEKVRKQVIAAIEAHSHRLTKK